MKRSFFSSEALVGLDIQPAGIYLVQLKKVKHEFLVEQIAACDLSENIFMEGKIKHWDVLRFALSDLVYTHKIDGMMAAVHLPAHLVRMQQIQIPAGFSAIDIEAEIYARIQSDLTGIDDRLSIDYIEYPQTIAERTSLFFAATRKEYLDQYVECIRTAGLKVKIVDVDIYAIKRMVCYTGQFLPAANEANAILSVIHGVARLLIFDTQHIQFYQQWDIAEMPDFSAQFRSKIQLFLAMSHHVEIKHLILCDMKNLMIADDLKSAFTFQVHHLDVFSRLKFASSDDIGLIRSRPAHFMIAAGLAMREMPLW